MMATPIKSFLDGVTLTVIGVVIVLVSLWGGTYVMTIVPKIYNAATFLTAAGLLVVGVLMTVRGFAGILNAVDEEAEL